MASAKNKNKKSLFYILDYRLVLLIVSVLMPANQISFGHSIKGKFKLNNLSSIISSMDGGLKCQWHVHYF